MHQALMAEAADISYPKEDIKILEQITFKKLLDFHNNWLLTLCTEW